MKIEQLKMPSISEENDMNIFIGEFYVKKGSVIKKDEPVCLVETESVAFEVSSVSYGIVHEVFLKVGDMIKSGDSLLSFEPTEVEEILEVDDENFGLGQELTELEIGYAGLIDENFTSVSSDDQVIEDILLAPSDYGLPEITSVDEDQDSESFTLVENISRPLNETGTKNEVEEVKKPDNAHNINDYPAFNTTDDSLVRNYAEAMGISIDKNFNSKTPSMVELLAYVKSNIKSENMKNQDIIKFSPRQKLKVALLTESNNGIPNGVIHSKIDVTELDSYQSQQPRPLGNKYSNIPYIIKALAKSIEKVGRINSFLSADLSGVIVEDNNNIGVKIEIDGDPLEIIISDTNTKKISAISQELKGALKKRNTNSILNNEFDKARVSINVITDENVFGFSGELTKGETLVVSICPSRYEQKYDNDDFSPVIMAPISLVYDERILSKSDISEITVILQNSLTDLIYKTI